jgi:hypothetical protein
VEVAGYRLRARLGAGGMGRVYLAFTPGGRAVALKVVRPEYGDDVDFRARFRQEIEAARQVHGLYTAQVLDAGPDAVPPWLVTAYVPGPSLAQAVREYGPMPAETVLLLMAGVAEALQAIHGAGVVHRDLKPSNVLLASDGPRVIDFGIARAVEATAVTRTGMRVGSPQFMAPEQIAGRVVTPAMDVFALGSLATFAVLGRPPFGEGGEAAVMYRILNEPPDLGDCPEPLRELVGRCLAKEPAERPGPGEIISVCRRHTAGRTLQIAQSWLPAGMAALLADHVAPAAPGPQPAAGRPPAFAPPSGAPTAYPPPAPATAAAAFPPPPPPGPGPDVSAPGAVHPPAGGPAGTRALRPGDAPGRRLSRAAIIAGAGAAVAAIIAVTVVATLLVTRGPGGPANGTGGHHPAAGRTHGTSLSANHRNGQSVPTTPQPTLAPNLDRCLIGVWKGINDTSPGYIYGQPVQYVGLGPTQTLWPNGRGKAYYGKRMVYRAKINGNVWTDVFSGYATFDWTAKNDVTRTYRVRSHGTSLLYENGVFQNSRPLRVLSGLGRYTCSGNSLQFFQRGDVTTLTRELPKPQPGS